MEPDLLPFSRATAVVMSTPRNRLAGRRRDDGPNARVNTAVPAPCLRQVVGVGSNHH
jgi:hypothetical protein